MSPPAEPQSFHTTRWTVVQRATGADDAAAQAALTILCESYWFPIYAFIRRAGKSPQDAEDLTQGFFARLLERHIFASADPAKGKLRTFLLTCVRNYLADEYDRAQAGKRGANLLISFDAAQAEHRYAIEPIDHLTPDRLFQRQWTLALLDSTLRLIEDEYAAQGRSAIFSALRPFLGFGTGAAKSYEEISLELGVPVGTLKNQVFRMRERWRELLLDQVANTLDNPTPEEVRGELSELLGGV
jgi:RNA polymerase sigma-70 factor (ECF subfamily)